MKYLYTHKVKDFKTYFDVITSPLDPDTFLDTLKYDIKNNYKRYENLDIHYLGTYDNVSGLINLVKGWTFDCDEYYKSICPKVEEVLENGNEKIN